jgi:hypothetical protein
MDRKDSEHVTAGRCRLLELPAELREQIWGYAVSEWHPKAEEDDDNDASDAGSSAVLYRRPVRIDRFNHTPPAAITATSSQTRAETLRLYYALNAFECWRPRFKRKLWIYSSLVNWFEFLGPEKLTWVQDIILMYKTNDELETNFEDTLATEGYMIPRGVIRHQLQLTEYEQCFEQLGLPRHFGRRLPRR